MDLALVLIDALGDSLTIALAGVLTGLAFGVAAERSAFCLRAATVEFARGTFGPRMAVWLLTFSTALVWVQAAAFLGLFRPGDARMMAIPGSWSGAIIGGTLFGIGMVLARGCSGRLLVLAATGNLRSVVSGLIFAVVAQMSFSGLLAPLRTRLAGLWITAGGHNLDLETALHLPPGAMLAAGGGLAVFAIWLARRNGLGPARLVFASGVGFTVALGYALTFTVAQLSFQPVTVVSLTFTGPSARTLMSVLSSPTVLDFDTGLIPGVVLGAMLSSLQARRFRFQGFDGPGPMQRAMIGAALMGFGGMLAGGCAIGNGVSGTSILASTAWVALTAMWVGAVATDVLVDHRGRAENRSRTDVIPT